MSEETYTQCRLRKNRFEQVAYIPTKHARKGHTVKVKYPSGVWNDGWEVLDTYHEVSKGHVEQHERDWAKQREASDI